MAKSLKPKNRMKALKAEIAKAGDFSAPVTGRGEMPVSEILAAVDAGELPASVLEEVPLGLPRYDYTHAMREIVLTTKDDGRRMPPGALSERARQITSGRRDYIADFGDGRGYRLWSVVLEEMLSADGWEPFVMLIVRQILREEGSPVVRQ